MKETLDSFLKGKIQTKDKEAYEFLLADPRGRWFIARLWSRNFGMTSTFTGNSDTFRREGARTVALTINDEIRQMGRDAILDLVKAEGEYHVYIDEQTRIFNAKKV